MIILLVNPLPSTSNWGWFVAPMSGNIGNGLWHLWFGVCQIISMTYWKSYVFFSENMMPDKKEIKQYVFIICQRKILCNLQTHPNPSFSGSTPLCDRLNPYNWPVNHCNIQVKSLKPLFRMAKSLSLEKLKPYCFIYGSNPHFLWQNPHLPWPSGSSSGSSVPPPLDRWRLPCYRHRAGPIHELSTGRRGVVLVVGLDHG